MCVGWWVHSFVYTYCSVLSIKQHFPFRHSKLTCDHCLPQTERVYPRHSLHLSGVTPAIFLLLNSSFKMKQAFKLITRRDSLAALTRTWAFFKHAKIHCFGCVACFKSPHLMEEKVLLMLKVTCAASKDAGQSLYISCTQQGGWEHTLYLTVDEPWWSAWRATSLVVQDRRLHDKELDAMWWAKTGPHMWSIIKGHKRWQKLEDISGRVAG